MAKTPEPEKAKPVVSVSASPWGDVSEEEFKTSTRDKFYVHGYSDRRLRNELEIAERGKANPLDWRLQYVTVEGQKGPTNERAAEYQSRGYVPVLYKDCAKYGIDPTQSGFREAPDGTCRVGSQMLMAAPAKVAAREAKKLDQINREQAGAVQARMEAATERWNQAIAGRGGERIAPIYEEEVTTERETR